MIYLDSSFFVSLYCVDINSSSALRSIQDEEQALAITPLVEFEFLNAIELKRFRREIAQGQATGIQIDFDLDISEKLYESHTISSKAYSMAVQLSRKFTATLGCRSADILHVASALDCGATHFYSFDIKQRALAEAVGLKSNAL